MPLPVSNQRRAFPTTRPATEEVQQVCPREDHQIREQLPAPGLISSLPSSHRNGAGAVPIPQAPSDVDEQACAELVSLLPTVVEVATDREGSRKLQVLLDHVSPVERALLYAEVLPMAHSLMQHVFGNHVMQRVLHYGTDAQRSAMLPLITENMIELCHNTFGCRVVQKALELHGKMLDMYPLFQGNVVALAADQNGNHVLQRFLELHPESTGFIFEELRGHIVQTSCLKYGCRVVQRLLATLAGNTSVYHEVLMALIDEIVSNLHHLVTDQFGNYVVQAVMTCNQPCGLKPVYILRGSYAILCRHKNASNVVETAFSVSPPTLRNALLSELCPFIVQLAGDQFGNFVVQKLFEQSDATQQASLSQAIRQGQMTLKTSMYGRSVLGMLQRKEAQQGVQHHVQQATASAHQLPQSLYVAPQQAQQPQPPLLNMSALSSLERTPCPSAPATPLTPASFTSSGDAWSHNPNYTGTAFPEDCPEIQHETPHRSTGAECAGSPDNDLTEAHAYGY